MFVAIFHCVYFFHEVVKLHLHCGKMCIFLISALSILGNSQVFFFFLFLLMFRSNLPLSVFPRDSSI